MARPEQHHLFAHRFGVSLFSGAGIGDLGLRAAGINLLAMCELETDRSLLAATNFPECRHYGDDISAVANDLAGFVAGQLTNQGEQLFVISCTAPCQGMSKNGQGTLLKNIREGKRPSLDPRNRLILPALQLIQRLRPLYVIFENVTEMRNTVIKDDEGRLRLILDVISDKLAPEYSGEAYNIEFADYGIPQRRQRLITVYSRDPDAQRRLALGGALVPIATHAQNGKGGRLPWVSVTEALSDFPPLDAREERTSIYHGVPYHHVPVLDAKKYKWISHTPPGASAFDNQCTNPECLFDANPIHGTERDASGINRGKKDTPLYCTRCGGLLPRPYTEDKHGIKRIMSGFTSAYKRMPASLPAPALTRNLSYPCSDQKVHPLENRVLSLAEAMTLQTISEYDYEWRYLKNGPKTSVAATNTLIRSVIGESVPPKFLEMLAHDLVTISFDHAEEVRPQNEIILGKPRQMALTF